MAMFTGVREDKPGDQDNQAATDTKGVVDPDVPDISDDPSGGGEYSG